MIDFGCRARTRRSIADALKRLTLVSVYSDYLYYSPLGLFHHGRHPYRLARYIFLGPAAGDEPVKIGLFAAIHGDDPESAQALAEFLLLLDMEPERARGYQIFVYPICNPTGFEDGTRATRRGHDLMQEIWKGSKQPEAFYIERELGALQFHGIVHLRSREDGDVVRARVDSSVLEQALVQPALKAAEKFLPGDKTEPGRRSSGTTAARSCEWGLVNPAELKPAPFEITFETPRKAPPELRKEATLAALHRIIEEYRPFLASHQNL
jgi:hypothetical protein